MKRIRAIDFLISLSDIVSDDVDVGWESELLFPRKTALCVTFCNPLSVKIGQQNKQYVDDLKKFNYIFCDGFLLSKCCSKIQDRTIARRSFDGNSLGGEILDIAIKHKIPTAIVGARMASLEAAARTLAGLGLNVVYSAPGFFTDKAVVAANIISSGAKLLIVGMGSPRQEEFLLYVTNCGWIGVGFTCGGYIDQLSTRGVQYYPKLVNKLNLRAPFRVALEPKRLLPRYCIDYVPFYLAVAAYLLKIRPR